MSSKKERKFINILSGKNSMEYTLLTSIRKNYTREDTKIISDSDEKGLDFLNDSRPFFSDKYLLIFYTTKLKMDKINLVIKKLRGLEHWDVIFIHETKKMSDIFVERLTEAKNVYLGAPPDWLISAHVKINIKYRFTIEGYESFIRRMKYQWRMLDEYVIQLNNYEFPVKEEDEGMDNSDNEFLTPKIVNSIIPKYDNINFNRMLTDLLLGSSMRKHMKQLEGYKYAYKYTYKTLMEKLTRLIKVKEDFLLGNLTLTNMVEYSNQNDMRYYECREMVNNLINLATLEKLYKIKHKMTQFEGRFNPLIEFFLDIGLI